MAVSIVPRSLAIEPTPGVNSGKPTAEYLRSILNYNRETGVFTRRLSTAPNARTGDVAGYMSKDGYLLVKVLCKTYKAHRLVWLYVHGEWPQGQIDHINRDRSDNRIANLRDVSHQQNQQNASRRWDNTSGYPGVCWHKPSGKWAASISYSKKQKHLGLFTDINEAVAARKAAERHYWADTQIAEPATV